MEPYSDDQQVFDLVARHLLTQMAKSVSARYGGRCSYRSPGELKCAIGCLIPDELYDPYFDRRDGGLGVGGLLFKLDIDHLDVPSSAKEKILECRKMFSSLTVPVLEALQQVHDSSPVNCWAADLRATAQHFKLSARVVREFEEET